MKGKGHQPAPASARSKPGCPIVGIGASAGGLEAFTQLLKELPLDTGFGFVLVQHLDPQHESALAQLLARATAMPVREVTQNLRVKANHIYIIPPNTSLGIARGVLKLLPRSRNRIAPRPIDFFFEALAKDQRERAVGVILSGSATDGTLGLEAIKAEGGLTFAQDDSARYDSMPRSAVAAGCVDFTLSPGNIATELARIARHPYVGQWPQPLFGLDGPPPRRIAAKTEGGGPASRAPAMAFERPGDHAQNAYQSVLLLLRNHCGVDFSLYKSATIRRRIARRAVLSGRDTLENYADFLRGNLKEIDALYADALIGVTSFFRNPHAFETLKRKIFPKLLRRGGDEPMRVWVLGCSTGQEAYSIAMSYAEAAEKIPRARKLQVFATDLNEANLEKARNGFYAKNLVHDISPERLRRFFVLEEGGYRVIKAVRELIVFARQNAISDPPFSRMDFISCRNLMIYLEPILQKRVLPAFHYALKPGGFLFLGASESIGAFSELFMPEDKKHKIFSRRAAATPAFYLSAGHRGGERLQPGKASRLSAPPRLKRSESPDSFRSELNAEREADRVTVAQFAPPAVLIDDNLQILQFRGPTSEYLEPPTGKASFDLLRMARDGLMLPLRAAINRARKENATVRKENVPVRKDGIVRRVGVGIVPLKNLKERCFLVLFEESINQAGMAPNAPIIGKPIPTEPQGRPRYNKREASRIEVLEKELSETRDYLRSVQERQEAANEELQASNEEGQSANEELQSLNEELETSKEELESTNEELTTVNEEMISRNFELKRLNGDLTNLQTSTKLVIVLLGRDLAIRRFSSQAEKQFGLVASDLGRPFGSVRHNLVVPDLEGILIGVKETGRESVHEVKDNSGRWFSLRARPYLTAEHTIDGVVLVLVDINDLKRTEGLISEAHRHAEAIIRTVPDPLLILSSDLQVQSSNDAFNRTFKVSPPQIKGRSIFEIGGGSWSVASLRRMLKEIISRNGFFDDFEVTRDFERIGRRSLSLNARTLNEPGDKPKEVLLVIRDITERKHSEEALRAARTQLSHHANQLERLVAARTGELTATNTRLKSSVESIRKGNEEYRMLLQKSEIMQKQLRHLTRKIITAQEEERKEISRELHDEVVQTLIGVNVELSALGRLGAVDSHTLKEKVTHTQRLVESSVNAVHRFARGLRPAVLDDLGLIPALTAYCKSVAAQKKIEIRLIAFGGVEALRGSERTVLFRVAQEALTNVARHAHATEVELRITAIPNAIRMEITDNGRSFEVGKTLLARNNMRLGLVGMNERIEMVGGTLVIESKPGRGTTVRAEIPFKREKIKK